MFKQWMAGVLALWSVGAWAEDQLCAVVLIEIAQELSFERQAFEATMRINNGLDTIALDELQIQVLFEDDQGNVVTASSDPNAEGAAFFIRLDDSQNLNNLQSGDNGAVTNGQVPAKASGVLRWLIIPTAGSAGDSLAGKRYKVGAALSYNAGGKVESLTVTPDTITVKPQPQLTLDYFLTQHVIADDAFTPEIEAPEPYTLGVRIRNSGRGEAKSVKLESAQPRIVGNELGLAINFRITNSFVDEAPAAPTLLLDFGQIAPGKNRNGRWLMESTLSGEFIDFSASFTHPDELGGRLTSLLDATHARFLLRDVLVDLPTRDRVRDFLALVGDDLYIFESDSTGQADNAPCLDCTPVNRLNGSLSGSSTLRSLTVSAQPGLGYVRVADPYQGSKGLQRVLRSNGSTLSPHNAWLSKERAEDGRTFNYYLNLFDTQPDSQYSVEFGELSQEPKAPVLQAIMDRSAHEGGQVGFLVRASDPNGTIPTLSAEGLPSGATFKDEGQGRGTFSWAPLQGQAGRYVVNFMASDGELGASLPVGIQIFRQGDSDGDGMDDAWEQEHFGNLDRDGVGDFDGDGVSDLDEFGNRTDPKVADATPLPPQLLSPADNAQVTDLYPALRVSNSPTQVSGQSLSYWFELYADEALSQLLAKSAAVSPGSNSTEWVVKPDQLEPDADLYDNRRYYWRVKVSNDKGSSEWLNGRFFINTANDAPTAPVLLSPTPMGLVADTRPLFSFNNSLDVDEEPLTYRVRVFGEDDDDFSQPLTEVSGLLPGADGVTSWQSPVALEEDRFYFWLVEAQDPQGAVTPSEPSLFGVSLSNKAPSAPGLAWPLQGQRIAESEGVTLRLDAANDPERRPLSYRIQLDDNERFDGVDKLDSDWFSAGAEGIQWPVPGALEENRVYHWRARASDGEQESEWLAGSFQVNQFQESPPLPAVDNPANGAWLEVRNPRLAVHPVQDADGDTLSYEFELYAEQGEQALASQVTGELHWTPSLTLDDNRWYRWRVRALDATGLYSPWSDWLRFFVNENGVDDAPSLSFVQPAEAITLSGGSVTLQWVDSDPDSAATIDLYANEQLIASGLAEDSDGDGDRFEWSLAGVEPGTYQIKALIRDASTQVEVAACCSVTLLPPTPEVRVTPVTSLELDEYGEAVAEIEVSLSRGPKAGQSVTLNLAISDASEARLLNQPAYLYFTADNWQTPQRIRVQGVDDCSIDGTQPVGLQLLPLQSSDNDFAGLDPEDVLLSTLDNEVEGQLLFVCHYQVVARGEVGEDGMVDISLRPELLNTGVALTEVTATPSLQGGDLSVSGASPVRFSKVLTGIRSQAHDTIVLRQPADQPLQFSRLHWDIVPGAAAPVSELGDEGGSLKGTSQDDILHGGAGNDQLVGSLGDDVLIGGAGEDILDGGAGNDSFIVEGNDPSAKYFMGGSDYDRILGGEGDDVLRMTRFEGQYHVELIDGGAGRNRIEGTAGADNLDLRTTELRNIEAIDGLAGNDRIFASQGSDQIIGGPGDDLLYGEGGDDSFLVSGQDQGIDKLNGGLGFDQVVGSAGDDRIGLSYFAQDFTVERIDGGDGRNVISGDEAANILDFSNSELLNIDLIDGGGGDDGITGSAGNDVIYGGPGSNWLLGGGGDDTFWFRDQGTELNHYDGGEGQDRLLGGASDDVLLQLHFGAASNIEEIDGNGGRNLIRGTAERNVFDFSGMHLQAIALIEGLAGNDQIIGSQDADVIAGGLGNDLLDGQGGDDTFLVESDHGPSTYIGGEGGDRILATEGDDLIRLERFDGDYRVERIDGGGGLNVIVPRGMYDTVRTFDFSATELVNIAYIQAHYRSPLIGSAGNDELRGDASGNHLFGGPGNDVLRPGRGNDYLYGGPGDDRYHFEGGRDFIEERGLAEDQDRVLLHLPHGPEQIFLIQSGDSLQLRFSGATDILTLLGWFSDPGNRIARIELTDGRYLPEHRVEALLAVMSTVSQYPSGRTPEDQARLDEALVQAWVMP
ncbi:MAG TPA: putative Ig domain-containing protein [Pseudomonas sp.]|uniref:putative Ig domain-containing protein n=1 Tax=Pseudomonas sp. TaxID=306 RepID=UPI002CB559B7|nr:putative Ig domain-containing protein [Pseudomonas sp.]HSX90332.1 putative Ig domain-containing protein [Pseudomonas sp.]